MRSAAMRLEEMPRIGSSDAERDFEMDEETDYLLQPPEDSIHLMMQATCKSNRQRRLSKCSGFFKHVLCG